MYAKLALRAEDMIVHQVYGEVQAGLKSHYSALASVQKQTSEHSDEIALSQSLLAPISLLSSHLAFLRSTLSQNIVTSLYRQIASQIADYILEREILYRGHNLITSQDGKLTLAACEVWIETAHVALAGSLDGGRKRVEAPWLRLLQAGRLVSSSGLVWLQLLDATFGVLEDEEWEKVMLEIVGLDELNREEVGRVLRTREDCER
jgi:hypothetical protein